ncbi:MAG: FadR/GntR family transcriptional regulator [Actinomycetota bacterium]|jgi:DNA-binding FadR family transcriptional regulator|nr:FadR/GntR family transcriptional regulator [Actinomycetota bacterium]
MSERAQAYPRSLRHARVVHDLGAAIVRGALLPGDVVPTEDQLVGQFGVGRSALREGVKVLAGKGLLESRTSAGTRVRPRESWNLLDPDVLQWRFSASTSPEELQVLADLRVALEPGVARLAAESTDIAARHEVQAAAARLWATVDEPEQFVESDLAFHRSIFVASGNELLLYVHDVVSGALRSIRPLHTHSVAHNRETLPNHSAVATAIVRGHVRRSEEIMREIVEVARRDALAVGRPGRGDDEGS